MLAPRPPAHSVPATSLLPGCPHPRPVAWAGLSAPQRLHAGVALSLCLQLGPSSAELDLLTGAKEALPPVLSPSHHLLDLEQPHPLTSSPCVPNNNAPCVRGVHKMPSMRTDGWTGEGSWLDGEARLGDEWLVAGGRMLEGWSRAWTGGCVDRWVEGESMVRCEVGGWMVGRKVSDRQVHMDGLCWSVVAKGPQMACVGGICPLSLWTRTGMSKVHGMEECGKSGK